MMNYIVKVLFLLFSVPLNSWSNDVISCRKLTYGSNQIQIGTVCKTQQGGFFERVDAGFLDTQTNLVWFDEGMRGIHHFDPNFEPPKGNGFDPEYPNETAIGFCVSRGLRLPTGWPEELNGKHGFPNHDSEFVSAVKNGIQEILVERPSHPYDPSRIKYYSSTVNPIRRNLEYPTAFALDLWSGEMWDILRIPMRGERSLFTTVRCVKAL